MDFHNQKSYTNWETRVRSLGGFMDNKKIALENKVLLNIKEASDLFGIGQHRLREIVHDDYENRYHLMLGRTIKIKRKQFEEYIGQVEQI